MHNQGMTELVHHLPGRSALVLDSPHSGTHYPADFLHACDLAVLRRAEDTHVEKLYSFAPALGAHWIEAHFPRSYLDANRGLSEMDSALFNEPWPGPGPQAADEISKVRLGKGLVWRMTDDGQPIYQRHLSVAEVQARIAQCWQPYHAALAAELAAEAAIRAVVRALRKDGIALLGIFADMDKPLSPSGEARQAFHNQLYGRTVVQRQQLRERLLSLSISDLQRVAGTYLQSSNASVAVVAPSAQRAVTEGLGLETQTL